MRKLTILLGLAVVIGSNTGCCCGKIRNWFHKGSPCGTSMAPAVLGAPLAMGTPMSMPMTMPVMSSPQMCVEAAPQCCVPCDPCYDPCGSGQMTTGYLGGHMSGGADCDCDSGQGTYIPNGAVMVSPGPLGDN